MTLPCNWDVVVPDDLCSDWSARSQTVQDTALWLASTFLWAATGRQYGACPVTIRPGSGPRAEVAYLDAPVIAGEGVGGLGIAGGPFLFAGRWFNAGCSSACCGSSSCAIVLRGPVTAVDEVLVGTEVVPASAYRVDVTQGNYLLVRIDGECWPICQNFSAEPGEEGSFEVTYDLGRAVPEALAIATALLACEYSKALSGGSCGLPKRMTRLSRQGVEVEIEPATPDGSSTGIKMVDDVILALNPGKRQRPPVILSPDLPENCDRRTVIGAGS